MDRRKFLIGFSSTAVAGGALLGTGAFSRVESQRDVTVQVAEDPDAYLGLSGTGSPNSDNYVSIDDNGHLAIDISEHDDFDGPDTQPGEGVNSDSFTWFDGMVEVCNQGKEDVGFYIEKPTDDDFPSGVNATGPDGTPYEDEPRLEFYTGEAALDGEAGTDSVMGEANAETVQLGECIELGVRVMTKGIDASDDTGIDSLFDEEVRLIADVTKLSTPNRSVYNVDQDEFFLDIQPALNDADPGDTVQVLTGTTFTGDVTIDTQGVTLVATSNHKPRIEGQVVVSAEGATLDGFEVSPPDATSTAESEAIRVSNTPNNVTVTNNTVVDFGRDDPGGGFYGVDGINVFGGDAGTAVENVSVTDNEVQGLRNPDQAGVAGISVQGNVVGATVENNDLSDLGEGVTSYGFGVTVRGTGNHGELPEDIDVLNNTISNVQSDSGPLLGVGLAVEADGQDYRFENNDIDDAELGAEIKTAAGETTLSGNSFDGTEIHLADVTGNVDLVGEIGSNDFGTAAATDDVSLSAYGQAIFPAIQQAIDASATGAGVDVGSGTYDEAVDIDVADLTLASIQGPAQTTVERGVDVQNGGVTVDGFEIRNPGTQGAGDPGSPGGLVGVDIASGNENVSVLDNVITDIGTGDDDANPIGVLASDGTSGVTVDNNEISNLEGTDEDEAQVQGVLINESGTQITGATVTNNTITGLLDTRSTNAVRFNGDVTGEILGNTISDLNTEGDIPGTNDPGGFTQVIALQEGGGSATGPSNVTVQGNDISNIETTTPGNFAPPVHLVLGRSASNVTVGGASSGEENSFSADSPDVEIFVLDNSGTLNLGSVQSDNSFSPSAQIGPNDARLFPGDLTLVTGNDDLQTQIDNANPGDTLAVAPGTFDAVTITKQLSLKSIFGRPTVEADSGTGRLEVGAPDVEISGFDISLSDGEVVYVNPGEGLTFRNNVVDVSSTSDHGIRIDDSSGGPTVVEANVFDVSSTDAGVNSQAILFSGGEDYLIRNNVINGPGKNADSPDDANAGILASVQADTTDADIQDNEISAFDQGVLLFENPPSANLDRFSITGNSISDTDTGVLAVELAGDGDTFGDINGESATSDQQQALVSDNTFGASVDTEADVQADP